MHERAVIDLEPHVDPIRPRPPLFRRRPRFVACSVCLSVLHDGRWVAAEEAIRTLRTFEGADVARLKEGLCECCETALRRRRMDVSAQMAA